MKVYASPVEFNHDYFRGNFKDWQKAEADHQEAVKAWLIAHGYTGKNTGRTVTFPVADGYAFYMMAEGSKSFLVHLPYGDAYQYRDVVHIPKKEILARMNANDRVRDLFKVA